MEIDQRKVSCDLTILSWVHHGLVHIRQAPSSYGKWSTPVGKFCVVQHCFTALLPRRRDGMAAPHVCPGAWAIYNFLSVTGPSEYEVDR